MPPSNHAIPLRNLRSQQRTNISFEAAAAATDNGAISRLFRLREVHIDVNKILHILKEESSPWEVMGQHMPPIIFDDLGPYGIGKVEQMMLWEFEVRRLVKAATNVEPPSLEGSPEWYGQPDAEGYEFLQAFAEQLNLAGTICNYDGDQTIQKFVPGLATSREKKYMRERRYVMIRIKMSKKDRLGQQHRQAYHALVNYITAVFVRIFIRTIKTDDWMEYGISTTAKLTAKLKVVGTDIDHAFLTSIERNNPTSSDGPTDSEEDGNSVSAVHGEEELYIKHLHVTKEYYSFVHELFHNIALNLFRGKRKQNPKYDCFEASAVTYDTGFRGARAQVWKDACGTVGVCGAQKHVRASSIAFDVCREIWEALPDDGHESALNWMTLDWSWTEIFNIRHEADVFSRRRVLTDMKSVFTAIIPYTMENGWFPILFSSCDTVIHTEESFEFYKSSTFLSAVRMRTVQYERTMMARQRMGQIYQSLYDTPLAKERGLVRLVGGDEDDGSSSSSSSMTQKIRQYRDTNEKYHTALQEVNSWVIDKRSIVITAIWYSYSVLAAIGVFTLSGIGMIALGQRVSGVDPSNLTMLTWTAAGFLIVYFKSIRVENWPWRDFLRGRVVCRSVSEVVAVTKMDAQTLMAVLMHHEDSMGLTKSGPFNILFRRVGDDGFAIDVPVLTETAMAGGYIFVCAQNNDGIALLGITTHCELNNDYISPHDEMTGKNVMCPDPLNPGRYRMQSEKGRKNSRSEPLSEYLPLHSFSWVSGNTYKAILGFYTEEACFGGVGERSWNT